MVSTLTLAAVLFVAFVSTPAIVTAILACQTLFLEVYACSEQDNDKLISIPKDTPITTPKRV